MLERIPDTKAVLNSPINTECRNLICAAIKAQTPLLSMIKRNPGRVLLGSANKIDAASLERAKCRPCGPFHLALLTLLASEGINALKLELPIAPDKWLLHFAREVGSGWDSFWENGQNPGTEEYGAFAIRGSDENALFSRYGNSPLVLSELLLNTRRAISETETFQALSDFRAGKINLYELRGVYSMDRVDLKEAKVHNEGVEVGTGGNLVLLPHVENRWEVARAYSEKLLADIANRLSVGFNPLL